MQVKIIPNQDKQDEEAIISGIISGCKMGQKAWWANRELPEEAIPLEFGNSEKAWGVPLSALQEKKERKSRVLIPFTNGEDPAHMEAVREKLPPPLRYLEEFFKKQADKLPPS